MVKATARCKYCGEVSKEGVDEKEATDNLVLDCDCDSAIQHCLVTPITYQVAEEV